jgi:BirA family biotin operon repressor/biotin-[acetyl-CoA-carboxylase] ligase
MNPMTEPPAPILAFETLDSTNSEARRRAEAGEGGPLWITARRQEAGRGRRGRVWETGEGNLAATHLFSTAEPPARAAQVSFVAALAVADLAAAFVTSGRISLKWPNDLLIDARKTAGILVESGPRPGGLWMAVGIGVNLASTPANPAQPATAFAEHMAVPPSPPAALEVLAGAFAAWRSVWQREGFAPIARAWTQRAHGLGERCTARLSTETVEGVAEGLDDGGALRLRTSDGAVRLITAGDVFF